MIVVLVFEFLKLAVGLSRSRPSVPYGANFVQLAYRRLFKYLCRYVFSDDPPPFMDGVRINSPHYLCKMVVQPGTSLFTLVMSQYERNNTIHYTLRVYSSNEFKLSRIVSPYNPKYDKQARPLYGLDLRNFSPL